MRPARFSKIRRNCEAVLVGIVLCATGSAFDSARAQVVTAITPDGTLGTNVTQPVPGFYNIDGGTVVDGIIQFHSFDQFSVGTGDGANFDGPAGIQNVLSRVTGGALSEIDGTVLSSIAGANVFLMNPSGVIFGPNSSLNVQGSFHATTADYIGFDDGRRFNAIPSGADAMLTSAAPAAFGFLDSSVASIDVMTPLSLFVPIGETLSLVGGDINLGAPDGSSPAWLLAPGGTVNVASIASSGEATFSSPINTDAFAELGDINMTGGSLIDAKQVIIRGGNFVIDESIIIPGILSLVFDDPDPAIPPPFPVPDGGEVDVKVRNSVTMTGTGPEPFSEAPPGILTFSGNFDILQVLAPAKVPDITIEANSVTLSGFATVQTDRLGPGDPPSVVINADTIKVENGAAFALFNFFEGPGGSLTLNAREVDLSGGGIAGGAAGATGLLVQGLFHPSWFVTTADPALSLSDSGTINVNASETVTMTGGAQITTDSLSFGRSDDVTIQAGDMLLSGEGQLSSQSAFSGDSGNVILQAAGSGRIEINDGFIVSTTTFGTGNSGRVDISATEAVVISGTASGIASQTQPQPAADNILASRLLGPGATLGDLAGVLGLDPVTADLFDVLGVLNAGGFTAVPEPLVAGDGGNITVTTPILSVSGQDSAIDSSTGWDGNAGTVDLDVGSLTVSNGAQVRSRSGLFEIGTGDLIVGTGNAGKINVNASGTNTITVTGANSQISTATFGEGAGGDITLLGPVVEVSNGGSIQAGGFGSGNAGNIDINTTNEVVVHNGSISTEATTSDGGNITINTVALLDLMNSTVETQVQSGAGAGGNIDIDPAAVVLQNSGIIANAFGGPGGNISIVAGQLIATNSVVSASSQLGIDGNVEINAPDTNITGKLVPLPKKFLDASKLLRDRCGAARGGTSGFSAQGRGGVPPGPDGYLPSYATGDADGHGSVTASAGNAAGSSGFRLETAGGPLLAMAATRCTW